MNILVTGVGSTLGYGILQTIELARLNVKVVGTDYFDTAVGLYQVDKGYILPNILLDTVSEENWLKAIESVILLEDIDYLLIGLDFEVPLFAKYKKDLEARSKCLVIVSSFEVVQICNDKWLTYKFLIENSLGAPLSCLPQDLSTFRSTVAFPWIVKPRQGSTSKGLFKVVDSQELEYALARCNDPVIQEEVGKVTTEYTCGVVAIGDVILSSIALRRTLKNGNTVVAYYEKNPVIDDFIRQVAIKLKPFGPINIQLRMTDGGPKVFEINPRFSGTTPVRARFGLNEIKIILDYLVENKMSDGSVCTDGMVIRYTTDCFVSNEDIQKVVKA